MLLCFTRLAWCLLLSLICKCPRVLQGNPEHACCRQRFYSLFVYRPLVANIVKVTVLSEWTNRFYWDGMMRFAASEPGMNQMCCAESLLLLVVINSGLQLVLYVSFYQYYRMEKAKMSLCIVIYFFVSVFLKNILVFNSHTKQFFFWGGETLYFLIAAMLNYFYSMLCVFLCLVWMRSREIYD